MSLPSESIAGYILREVDPITDEGFAHFILQPMAAEQFIPTNLSRFGRYEGDVKDNDDGVSLTPMQS